MAKSGRNQRFHYAWVILLTCCFMQGVGIGIISNCSGIYYQPICDELGFGMGELTLYRTISGLCSVLPLALAPKLVKRVNICTLSFLLLVICGGTNLLMAFGTELWHWYFIGILQGCTVTVFSHFIPVSVINNWFCQKKGLALGISSASAGVLGIIMNEFLSYLIMEFGWRTSVFASGVVFIMLPAPFLLFALRYRPEDAGMKPYGRQEESLCAVQETNAGRNISFRHIFLLVLLFAVLAKGVAGFAQYFTSYGKSRGMAARDCSMLLTLYLVGNTLFKLVFGSINDKWGLYRSTALELGVMLLGCVLLLIPQPVSMLCGALLFGMCAMICNVQSPLLIRSLWSTEEFPEVYARISLVANVCHYLFITVFGFLFDVLGRYEPILLLCGGLVILEMTALLAIVWCKKRYLAHN